MSPIELNDPARFSQILLSCYLENGFQSLTKKDVDLLIFLLLELDGVIDRSHSNYDLAKRLRLTPSRVKVLRREAYARWRPLVSENKEDALSRILKTVLTEENIDAGAKHASEKKRNEGFLALRIEHPDDRTEFEQAILEVGAIPVYERNRDVLDVHFETLIKISESVGFISQEPDKLRSKLKQLAPTAEELQAFLKKPVKDLTWREARAVLNSVGAKAVGGIVDTKVTDLLKIIFPFL